MMKSKDLDWQRIRQAVVAWIILVASSIQVVAAVPETERDALTALYDATNGTQWADRTNWRNTEDTGFNTEGTECTWLGVSCDVEEAHVISLDLSGNLLSGIIPDEIANLTHLQTLYLDTNQLTGEIPAQIGNLDHLQVLHLYSNQLSGSIPHELGNLNAIQNIGLAYNQLTGSIPAEIGNLGTLQRLYLSANRLQGTIPENLGSLISLLVLYLSANKLNGEMPSSITNLTNLFDGSGLEIRWNAVHTNDAGIDSFLTAKQASGGDWASSQTIAPENIGVADRGGRTLWLSWNAVGYQTDGGGYEVYYSQSGANDWLSAGWTDSKLTTSFPVSGLEAGTAYDLTVTTFTDPHPENPRNTVESDPGAVVTTSTLSNECLTPVIQRSWGNPIELSVSGTFLSFLWSSGEETETIEVNPETPTWFWVTVTGSDSCSESGVLLIDPDEVFRDGFESGGTTSWSTSVQ